MIHNNSDKYVPLLFDMILLSTILRTWIIADGCVQLLICDELQIYGTGEPEWSKIARRDPAHSHKNIKMKLVMEDGRSHNIYIKG